MGNTRFCASCQSRTLRHIHCIVRAPEYCNVASPSLALHQPGHYHRVTMSLYALERKGKPGTPPLPGCRRTLALPRHGTSTLGGGGTSHPLHPPPASTSFHLGPNPHISAFPPWSTLSTSIFAFQVQLAIEAPLPPRIQSLPSSVTFGCHASCQRKGAGGGGRGERERRRGS